MNLITTQIIPMNDSKSHIESGIYCHCKPRLEDTLVIHNAYDGREFYEEEEGFNKIKDKTWIVFNSESFNSNNQIKDN